MAATSTARITASAAHAQGVERYLLHAARAAKPSADRIILLSFLGDSKTPEVNARSRRRFAKCRSFFSPLFNLSNLIAFSARLRIARRNPLSFSLGEDVAPTTERDG